MAYAGSMCWWQQLGQGRSAARARRLGPGALFSQHVERLRRLAERHGKRLMIWADFALKHPEHMDDLDDRVVIRIDGKRAPGRLVHVPHGTDEYATARAVRHAKYSGDGGGRDHLRCQGLRGGGGLG